MTTNAAADTLAYAADAERAAKTAAAAAVAAWRTA